MKAHGAARGFLRLVMVLMRRDLVDHALGASLSQLVEVIAVRDVEDHVTPWIATGKSAGLRELNPPPDRAPRSAAV